MSGPGMEDPAASGGGWKKTTEATMMMMLADKSLKDKAVAEAAAKGAEKTSGAPRKSTIKSIFKKRAFTASELPSVDHSIPLSPSGGRQSLTVYQEVGLPACFGDALAWLETSHLDEEGIFRRAASKVQVDNLAKEMKNHKMMGLQSLDMFDTFGPIVVSEAIKLFLMNTVHPLLTYEIYDYFVSIRDISGSTKEQEGAEEQKAQLAYIDRVLGRSPKTNIAVLRSIVRLLSKLDAHSEVNKMPAHNLAIAFTPCILRAPEDKAQSITQILADSPVITSIVQTMILNFDTLFAETAPVVLNMSTDRNDATESAADSARNDLKKSTGGVNGGGGESKKGRFAQDDSGPPSPKSAVDKKTLRRRSMSAAQSFLRPVRKKIDRFDKTGSGGGGGGSAGTSLNSSTSSPPLSPTGTASLHSSVSSPLTSPTSSKSNSSSTSLSSSLNLNESLRSNAVVSPIVASRSAEETSPTSPLPSASASAATPAEARCVDDVLLSPTVAPGEKDERGTDAAGDDVHVPSLGPIDLEQVTGIDVSVTPSTPTTKDGTGSETTHTSPVPTPTSPVRSPTSPVRSPTSPVTPKSRSKSKGSTNVEKKDEKGLDKEKRRRMSGKFSALRIKSLFSRDDGGSNSSSSGSSDPPLKSPLTSNKKQKRKNKHNPSIDKSPSLGPVGLKTSSGGLNISSPTDIQPLSPTGAALQTSPPLSPQSEDVSATAVENGDGSVGEEEEATLLVGARSVTFGVESASSVGDGGGDGSPTPRVINDAPAPASVVTGKPFDDGTWFDFVPASAFTASSVAPPRDHSVTPPADLTPPSSPTIARSKAAMAGDSTPPSSLKHGHAASEETTSVEEEVPRTSTTTTTPVTATDVEHDAAHLASSSDAMSSSGSHTVPRLLTVGSSPKAKSKKSGRRSSRASSSSSTTSKNHGQERKSTRRHHSKTSSSTKKKPHDKDEAAKMPKPAATSTPEAAAVQTPTSTESPGAAKTSAASEAEATAPAAALAVPAALPESPAEPPAVAAVSATAAAAAAAGPVLALESMNQKGAKTPDDDAKLTNRSPEYLLNTAVMDVAVLPPLQFGGDSNADAAASEIPGTNDDDADREKGAMPQADEARVRAIEHVDSVFVTRGRLKVDADAAASEIPGTNDDDADCEKGAIPQADEARVRAIEHVDSVFVTRGRLKVANSAQVVSDGSGTLTTAGDSVNGLHRRKQKEKEEEQEEEEDEEEKVDSEGEATNNSNNDDHNAAETPGTPPLHADQGPAQRLAFRNRTDTLPFISHDKEKSHAARASELHARKEKEKDKTQNEWMRFLARNNM
eukprot:TRINITY_DN188_c0_g1_i1.p1 TRINITY_DN188_c0_g1~~TRINITY_DN188_c0_g1_i1.p1  ORF type:complete len:1308 (+),score=353.58 TRINITY_DN188_c0_g1_i1:351-4274(+)